MALESKKKSGALPLVCLSFCDRINVCVCKGVVFLSHVLLLLVNTLSGLLFCRADDSILGSPDSIVPALYESAEAELQKLKERQKQTLNDASSKDSRTCNRIQGSLV